MTANLAAALAKVQMNLPELERDRTVEVTQKSGGTYSYSYATLANLSKVALPLLAKHGLSFSSLPGTGSDGKMCLRYHLLHESGELLTGEFPISGEGGIQMIGGRITYARRYCLAAVVGLAAEEDDDARLDSAARPAARTVAPPQRIRPTNEPPLTEEQPWPETKTPPERTVSRRTPDEPTRTSPTRAASESQQPSPGSITAAQQKMLHALLRDTDRGDRDVALVYISGVLEREIQSTKELSKADAGKVIDALNLQASDAAFGPFLDDGDPQ